MATTVRRHRKHSYGRVTCAQRRAALAGALCTIAMIGLLVLLVTRIQP